ncbi:hypothetical protein LEP1GSC161_4258 [Leptospira santarosai str. CBC1416]|uniref:DUF2335 domain-containing protein n=1 Tax=Leptospira santarosai str. CBC1416 TaxID=1193059 RepID=M6WAE9_9LEPT|nr:hypothetical protein [Leptospira santarosai]EMO58763.1 hypothetical protein LEP1GSC161_4258 [Leptospira santarosai str. CBC1416]
MNEKEPSIMDILNKNPKNETLSSDQFNSQSLFSLVETFRESLNKKWDDEKEVQLKTIELESKANEQNHTIAIETLRDEIRENSSIRNLRFIFSLLSCGIVGFSFFLMYLNNPMGEKILSFTLTFISGIFIGRGSVKIKKDE